MGVKDVDLCEKRQSEEPPDLFRSLLCESLTTKNDWIAITGKELQELMNCIQFTESHTDFVDLQEAEINVHSSVQCKASWGSLKTEISPAFTRDPIPVSGPNAIEAASFECDDQSNLEPVCDADGQRDDNDVCVPELTQPILKSNTGHEEKNQLKDITVPTLSLNLNFLIWKWFWRVVWIVTHCYASSMVPGADATCRGFDFPPFIELHHPQVPQLDNSRWLLPRRTIQRYDAQEGNKLHQNLRINNSEVDNYALEIVQTGGNVTLKRYFLKALKSCALAENEDLLAFMEGKKSSVVELSDGTIVVKYLLLMQNQTLQVHLLEGTDRQLDLHVQCSFTFETIDPVDSVLTANNSEKETTNVENGGKENSSDVLQILGYVFAAVAILTICLVFYCVVKHLRKRVLKNGIKPQEQEHLSSGPAESPA